MKRCVFALLFVAVLAFSPGMGHANLVTNFSFEDPNISPATFQIFSPTIPGWTSTIGAGIEIQRSAAGSPFDGFQHVELDSDNSSNMYQDISTSEGQEYLLGFAYSPRPGITSNAIQVLWGGGAVDTLDADGSALLDTNWTFFTYPVFGLPDTTRLEFVDAGQSDTYGGYLDCVVVVAINGDNANGQLPRCAGVPPAQSVPEPATLFLLASGLAGVGALVQRRQRRK